MSKSIKQTKKTESEWFELVVENAISFLNSSIESIEKSPKNSIIDLYTAIELFFKARLMKEHWSLILSKPEDADIDKFYVGDFRTVFLSQAYKRLQKVCNDEFDISALDNFLNLGMHRNQIVHFAHTNFENGKAEVVIEVWASWFYLYQILTTQWQAHFKNFEKELNSINDKIKAYSDYLESVLEIKQPQIELEKKKGNEVVECPSCALKSAVIIKDTAVTKVSHFRPVNTWGPINSQAKKYTCLVCNVAGFKLVDTEGQHV